MSDRDQPKPGGRTIPWSAVTTAPLDLTVRSVNRAPAAPEPGGPGEEPIKIADVKRSAEVEALLKAHSYARPLVPLDRASTDGDTAAAHQVGPRAVPVGVDTPAPEPRLQLSQSLVEDMKSPPAPKAVAVAVAVKEVRAAEVITAEPLSRKAVHAAPRQIDVQTYVLTRRSPKRVALMTVGAIAILGATVWIVRRASLEEEGGKGPSAVVVPVAPAVTAAEVPPPVVPQPVLPAPVPPTPVASSSTPAPAEAAHARPVTTPPPMLPSARPAHAPRPAASTPTPRPSPPTDEFHTDFKVNN